MGGYSQDWPQPVSQGYSQDWPQPLTQGSPNTPQGYPAGWGPPYSQSGDVDFSLSKVDSHFANRIQAYASPSSAADQCGFGPGYKSNASPGYMSSATYYERSIMD